MSGPSRPLWKILGPAREAIHGGTGVWPEPGEWLEVDGPIQPCRHGLHLCRQQDLTRWARVGAVVWTVETTGPVVDDDCKVMVGRARLVEPVGRITERVLRLTAADIAESVAHRDPECMGAIRVARLYALGLATAEEAESAWSAAWSAAREAARFAARESARSAAWFAARSAARSAAREAAWEAARFAAWEAAPDDAREGHGRILLDNAIRWGRQ